MTLEIRVGERLDDLTEQLAAAIDGHRSDPFTRELVVVPSVGARRWVEQRIAARLGVVANVDFVLPGEFSRSLKAAVSNESTDRWDLDSLTGEIFDLGNPLRTAPPVLLDLIAPLHGDGSWMTRSRYIADLFDRYGMHRPQMLTAWAEGRDVDPDGKPLPPTARWQPALWRMVRERAGISPAEQLDRWATRIRTGESLADLPEDISVFGLSSMSMEFVQLLDAVANTRNVALLVQVSSADLARQIFASPGTSSARHPLLSTWGKSQNDGLALIATKLATATQWAGITAVPTVTPHTLLAQVQSDLRANTAPAEPPRPGRGSSPLDASMQFHACSGHARQVEVVRDALLHLLANNPDLTEADITVVCPRLDRYAPLIEAIWGRPAGHDEPNDTDALPLLRYSINQTSLSSAAPLLDAVAKLFTLLSGRVTHSGLASFLTLEPVRMRFGLADDYDLNTAIGWLERTAMRWGISSEHRAAHSTLPSSFHAHTLEATIDALTASMALRESEVSPLGPAAIRLDLSQFELAGQIADFAQALVTAHDELITAGPAPASEWRDRLSSAAAAIFEIPKDESWQLTRFQSVLDQLLVAAPNGAPLTLDDVIDAFTAHIEAQSGWRRFGTGAIIIDEPQALRSVPHRVVAVLGFDDDAIPRPVSTHDDLIAASPQLGDRDRRLDAKQQLLDATLAAGDHLIVTFSDHNIHTNAHIPPSVALQELLDVVAATAGVDDDKLITVHTRYAHTESNFTGDDPWSFDQVARDASLARTGRTESAPIVLPEPIELPELRSVSVNEVVRAAAHPVDIYVQQTLGIRFPPDRQLPSDFLPVEQDGLEKWALGSDLLDRSLRGLTLDDWTAEKRAAGQLPPGVLAEQTANTLQGETDKITQAIAIEFQGQSDLLAPKLVPIDLDVGPVNVYGSIMCRLGRVIDITYSRRKGGDEVMLWVRALLLAAQGHNDESLIFSKGGDTFRCAITTHDQLAIDDALAFVVRRYADARRRVVPVFGETSKFLGIDPGAVNMSRQKADSKAREAWFNKTTFGMMGDRTRSGPAAFFADRSFDDLIEAPIGARQSAQELWGHIRATTSLFGVEASTGARERAST